MKKTLIAIVDYGAGNLKSVETAFSYLGADFFISSQPAEIFKASKLVIPGVGEAFSAMRNLIKTGLDQAIKDFFQSGKPILGICLGCQLILERSEERETKGLGLIKGTVKAFHPRLGYKVPHMGWNQIRILKSHPLLKGVADNSSFYFVHSFYPEPAEQTNILAETDYILTFPSAISFKNLTAFQFHPEKSGRAGLKILANFCDLKE